MTPLWEVELSLGGGSKIDFDPPPLLSGGGRIRPPPDFSLGGVEKKVRPPLDFIWGGSNFPYFGAILEDFFD